MPRRLPSSSNTPPPELPLYTLPSICKSLISLNEKKGLTYRIAEKHEATYKKLYPCEYVYAKPDVCPII